MATMEPAVIVASITGVAIVTATFQNGNTASLIVMMLLSYDTV